MPKNVDDGAEQGIRESSDLPEAFQNIDPSLIDARHRKLEQMEWTSFARRIFELQNKIRVNPKSFIATLEASLNRFKGDIYTTDDGCSAIVTEEGPMAFIEAIEFLRAQKPVRPLKWSDELARAGKDHCNDLGLTGQMSSIGTGKFNLLYFKLAVNFICSDDLQYSAFRRVAST